jgi:hypothetical protein
LAKVTMEWRFPAEQIRKQKFLFWTNTEFPFSCYFVWPI